MAASHACHHEGRAGEAPNLHCSMFQYFTVVFLYLWDFTSMLSLSSWAERKKDDTLLQA